MLFYPADILSLFMTFFILKGLVLYECEIYSDKCVAIEPRHVGFCRALSRRNKGLHAQSIAYCKTFMYSKACTEKYPFLVRPQQTSTRLQLGTGERVTRHCTARARYSHGPPKALHCMYSHVSLLFYTPQCQ